MSDALPVAYALGYLPGTAGSVGGCCLAEGAGVEAQAAGGGAEAYRGTDNHEERVRGGGME